MQKNYPFLAKVPRAVFLVDYHGIADVLHPDVLKVHIRDDPGEGCWPRLDSDAVICAREGAVPHIESIYGGLVPGSPQAADADPVARPTVDTCHMDFLGTVA